MVARDISARTGAQLVPISSLMDKPVSAAGAGALGFVFPIYHGGLPLMLTRFIGKMEIPGDPYLFGVGTYGDHPGLALQYLKELLGMRGGRLAAGFSVHMPYNYLTPPAGLKNFLGSFTLREIAAGQQQELFTAEKEKTARIAEYINARRAGVLETDTEGITRLADALNLKETLGKSTWLKIAGVRERTQLSFLESRQLMDRGFHVDESCSGCGICARVCPAGNISMAAGRPDWQQRCEQCFACLQWCPEEALQFGSASSGKKRYHHPEVNLADMLAQ